MQLLRHLSELSRFQKPIAMAFGVFDGVHLGHRAVLQKCVHAARACNGLAAALTFHPHPAKILRPHSAPKLLTTEQQDYELFSALDIDLCIILDFSKEFSRRSPEKFLREILQAAPKLQAAIVGHNWRFGHDRGGNFQLLQTWARSHSLKAVEVAPISINGKVVSSTIIRKQISGGEIEAANQNLGRPYQIVGRVVPGMGLGSRLGFPTANIEPESELVPSTGVYAARMLCEGGVFAAAVNIGCRPTVLDRGDLSVEAHLLDFEGDLYGHHTRLDFLSRIRNEKKFRGIQDLKAQIALDCEDVRRLAYS